MVVETTRPLSTQEQADCVPSKDPKVVREDVGEPECGVTTIQVKVTTTTYSYTYSEQTNSWVESATETVTYETDDLAAAEQTQCPTYGLSVVCTSAGPDYGAWLVTNNANQAANVDGVSIPSGGSHVFDVVADAVTFDVVWNDGLHGTALVSGRERLHVRAAGDDPAAGDDAADRDDAAEPRRRRSRRPSQRSRRAWTSRRLDRCVSRMRRTST